MVHIVSGILFLVIAFAAPALAALFLKVFGVVYLLLGILGFFTIGSAGLTELLGFLPVNGADNYLHVGLGIIIFLGRNASRSYKNYIIYKVLNFKTSHNNFYKFSKHTGKRINKSRNQDLPTLFKAWFIY